MGFCALSNRFNELRECVRPFNAHTRQLAGRDVVRMRICCALTQIVKVVRVCACVFDVAHSRFCNLHAQFVRLYATTRATTTSADA